MLIQKYKLNNINFLGKIYKIPEIKFFKEYYGEDWKIPIKYSYSEGIVNKHKKNLL